MKKFNITYFLLLLSAVCFSQAGQVQWYASPTGNDGTGNGTLGNPYKTVTYASTFLTAGDTLFLRGGTYFNDNYLDGNFWKQQQTARINNVNGATNNYIVVMPYNNESPVLRGDGDFILQIRNSSYLIVIGLEIYGIAENIPLALAFDYQFAFRRNSITNPVEYRLPPGTNTYQSGLEDISNLDIFRPYYFFTHGIVVQGSHHIDVVNNKVHHLPGEGVRIAGSDYINAIGNEVYANATRSATGVHGMSCYTLKSIDNNDAVKVVFSRNKVYSNYNEVPSWSESKTIFNPLLDEGKGLTIQRTEPGTDGWNHGRILFENNLSYGNGLSGIQINVGHRVDIINNTVYNNNLYGHGNSLGITVQSSDDVKVYNNICVADLSWGGNTISSIGSSTNLGVSNNLINGGLNAAVDAIDVNTLVGNPLFVNEAASNFNLQATSPARNNSLSSVAPLRDYFDFLRDAQPDRGAIEYLGIVPVKYINLSAELVKNDAVKVLWSTQIDNYNHKFVVEHSINGVLWQPIETVLINKTLPPIYYSYVHKKLTQGENYYRIKQVDFDGTFTYSAVKKITNNTVTLSLYPNPATNFMKVKGINKNQAISVYAANGSNVTSLLKTNYVANTCNVNISALPIGAYYLNINNNFQKFLKQ